MRGGHVLQDYTQQTRCPHEQALQMTAPFIFSHSILVRIKLLALKNPPLINSHSTKHPKTYAPFTLLTVGNKKQLADKAALPHAT
jgi:hypothetical protein